LIHVEQTLIHWVGAHGVPALYALMALGVFGLPIPDETLLVMAGLFISRGELQPVPTALAGVGGAMTGISVSYAVGRIGGTAALARYGSLFRIDHQAIERVHRWFDRFGKWLLTVGYFVPGVRHFTAIVAGASGLEGHTFAIFAYSGAVSWVSCFLLIGYFVGDEWPVYAGRLHRHIGLAAAAVAAVALVWVVVTRARRAKQA
jgi:membrane protein DedA with SNARE-associated domain